MISATEAALRARVGVPALVPRKMTRKSCMQLRVAGYELRGGYPQLATGNSQPKKWPREPLPPGAVLSALAAAKGHSRQLFASVTHRLTVAGPDALTSAMKHSRRPRRPSDTSPHCGPRPTRLPL